MRRARIAIAAFTLVALPACKPPLGWVLGFESPSTLALDTNGGLAGGVQWWKVSSTDYLVAYATWRRNNLECGAPCRDPNPYHTLYDPNRPVGNRIVDYQPKDNSEATP